MDYYRNAAAERHLCGGALLAWEDFAPYADRVREELFGDAETLCLWRAACKVRGDVAAVPPALYDAAVACVAEYEGASPGRLIAMLEDALPRRQLQEIAVEITRAVDAGDEVGEIVVYATNELGKLKPNA